LINISKEQRRTIKGAVKVETIPISDSSGKSEATDQKLSDKQSKQKFDVDAMDVTEK